MKAIKKALHIIDTEESPQKVRIDSDSESVMQRIANLRPAIPFKSADKSDILHLNAALHDEGHRKTFTWCICHCGVVWNEMADGQSRYRDAANQEDVRHNYDTEKATIRRATRGGYNSHEIICRLVSMKGETLDRIEELKLSRKEQTTMGLLRSGHNPELKYWLYKIGRAVDTVCWKCGIGEVDSRTRRV